MYNPSDKSGFTEVIVLDDEGTVLAQFYGVQAKANAGKFLHKVTNRSWNEVIQELTNSL